MRTTSRREPDSWGEREGPALPGSTCTGEGLAQERPEGGRQKANQGLCLWTLKNS